MRKLPGILLMIVFMLEAGAIVDSFTQPSDREIRDSFVDIWEPSAIVIVAVQVVLSVVFVVASVSFVASPETRAMSVLVLVCCVAAGVHWTLNHIALSKRAEAITGVENGRDDSQSR